MKKRFTLMMMVLCFLMSIPLKMMALTNSEFEKLYLIGGVPNKWSEELNRPFETTNGDTYKYVFVAEESSDYYFPMQKCEKIECRTSLEVICPVTSPRALRQSCRSIDRNSPLTPAARPSCTRWMASSARVSAS